jgi:hypothetical protein
MEVKLICKEKVLGKYTVNSRFYLVCLSNGHDLI